MHSRTYHYKPTTKQLILIYAASRLGWTNKELSVLFNLHRNSITPYIKKGYELVKQSNVCTIAKSERSVRIMPVGSTTDIEYIAAKQEQKTKGKRTPPKLYNDNCELYG